MAFGAPHNLTDLTLWREKARAGDAPVNAVLRKQYIPDQIKAEDEDSRKLTFTISTGAVDRDRDTLKVSGWDLESYRKNPVVLWAHDYRSLPVARAESIKTVAGALKATADFVPAEVSAFADTVFQMLKGGFLRATSVGFRPTKHAYDDERGGYDFLEQELLEFSIVPVPANPEALLDAKAAGIPVMPYVAYCERALDEFNGEAGLWVSKADYSAALKALAEPRIVVPAFDAGPVLAEFQKRGRTLSAANEARIRGAADAASAIGLALDEVLAQVAEAEEPKAVYTLAPSGPKYHVNAATVKAAVVAAVSDEVRRQINHAAGRLD